MTAVAGDRDHHLSGLPKAARPFQGKAAGVVTRTMANAVDVVVVVVILGAGLLVVNGAALAIRPLGYEPVITPLPITLLVGVVVTILYLTSAWASTGRTVGNAVLGVRVVDAGSAHRLGPARALIRATICTLFPVGLLWALVSADRRSVHDRLVGSAVVYRWSVA